MTMKTLMIAATATLLTAAPLVAQERGAGGDDARGYVTGLGGFATSVTNTTGDVRVEGGVRIAPHVMVYGNVGRFGNLQGDLQPTLDATTSALAANQGLAVVGGGSVPAKYVSGGLRVEVPTHTRAMPYVLGGVGVARLDPSAKFTFSSGPLPDGSSPAVGDDVTSTLTTRLGDPRRPRTAASTVRPCAEARPAPDHHSHLWRSASDGGEDDQCDDPVGRTRWDAILPKRINAYTGVESRNTGACSTVPVSWLSSRSPTDTTS